MTTNLRVGALLLFTLLSSTATAQQPSISEPMLPSDTKECVAMDDEFQSAVRAASRETDSCNMRNAGRQQTRTNAACLENLSDSIRGSVGFMCNEYPACSAQNTAFYQLLKHRREAGDSCYEKVRVYKAVEQGLKDLVVKEARDADELADLAAEAKDLANFTRSRNLELQEEIEARAAARMLENQRVARAFHSAAMKEFYRRQGEYLQQYQEAMDQVFKEFQINQNVAANARDTQLALSRGALDSFSSAYRSVGERRPMFRHACVSDGSMGVSKQLQRERAAGCKEY